MSDAEDNLAGNVGIKSQSLKAEQVEKLSKLIKLIPDILKELKNSDYDEIFGYRINVDTESQVNVPVRNEILLKFLIANDYDVQVTKEKLVKTLNWRNEFKPLSAAYLETHDKELDTLGAITKFNDNEKANLKVVTWNFYGNLKSPKKLFEKFGDAEGKEEKNQELPGSRFLRWRIGLMERSLALVNYSDPQNHKIAQIHDYNNVSMFRIDPGMKAATKEIIEIFGNNYPELLSTKFFINVPTLMSWVFTFFNKIGVISEETLKKFQILNNGNLSSYFGESNLPKEYNGGKTTQIKDIFGLENSIKSSMEFPEYGKHLLDKHDLQDNLSVE